MKNKPLNRHDVVHLLRTFSQKELKRFSLYLGSEYFNTRNALKALYSEIIKYHPLYTHVNCTKETLYKIVYPALHYNGGTMRDLLSELYEAAADFVTFETIRNRKNNDHIRINELRERGLAKQAFKHLDNSFANGKSLNKIDSEYFLQRYNLLIEKVNLDTIFRHQASQRSISRLFEEVKDSELTIQLFSILEITANYSNIILIEERFHGNDPDNFMNNRLNELYSSGLFKLAKETEEYKFVVDIYKAMLDALYKRGNLKLYKIYRDHVKKHSAKLSHDEVSMHYSKLISCCILGTKYGRNKEFFDNELFTLYFNFLEKELYRDNKTQFIPSVLYRTIILHAIKMNKPAWLKKVINRFIHDIQPADKENMKIYSLAFYYYASGRNGKALETIGHLNITQFIFKYDIYNLKLRIFYEDKNYIAASELIHSYRQFLRTDKLMPSVRKAFHRTFMKYASRLIKISEGSNKFEAGLEMQRLEGENCVNKEWLLEKLALLEKPKRKYSMTG